ncbi:CobW family GTP-binding protein [Rhodoplanes sp. Z2-YC6860]|uniref:CobW family GTP-binding protein n=1 Tax=Rhodoplanes sp. Z2-YC6860 TaxID=674703 RepID=UPI00078EDF32|nr:GTP-binding protein [Rhodoplanes sp. Z2-YC6860]AMN39596.1 cobalamin synthesis protein/P47K family protein [Rhodoplanes sp. Z2-YC6860]
MSDTIFDLFPSASASRFGRRQKRARGSRLPVTIVTGFLGAGKTTLVRRFLESPEGRGTALVVNEFGSEGIDDALLRESSDEVTLLGNGCLCCNTRSDLQIALRRLIADRDRGKIPHFDRVLIETSGLADISPILQTFSTDRALGGEFAIEVVLTVVDAVSGLKNLERAPEARKQAILADRIVISKSDISDIKTVRALTARLAELNPRAVTDVAVRGDIDPRCLIDTGQSDAIERHTGFVAEASHSDDVTSFVMRSDTPWNWPVFHRAMDTLITLRGPDLLRIKGLLNLEGSKGPVVFQAVQHLMHPPVELSAWPDADHASRVVFITRGVTEKQVQDLFAACSALGYVTGE